MKKETFGKLASFPETSPETISARPKEETQTSNKQLSANQADTNEQGLFTGELSIRIPKSLHAQLNEQAIKEGVSITQYILYKLAR